MGSSSVSSSEKEYTELDTVLAGNIRRRFVESFVKFLMGAGAIFSLLISVAIVWSLVSKGVGFIVDLAKPEDTSSDVGLGRLWMPDSPTSPAQWAPRFLFFDLKTLLVGSLVVTFLAMLVAVPLGLGTAVYLSEYASKRVRNFLKPALEVLAGVPSIVIGFFALTWITPNVVKSIFPESSAYSLLAAGLGVGLLTIPLVASISEDSLRSVPKSLREASVGLGAQTHATTLRVVLPAAVSGLVAAFIIAASRAIGETMVVFMAAGASGNQALFTINPSEPGSTMTSAMASQVSGSDNVVSDLAFGSLFFVGLVLFVLTFVLNIIADRVVKRIRLKY